MSFTSEHGVLPLEPIEAPRSLFVRFLYVLGRRRYGRVPTAFRVVYPRAPVVTLMVLAIVVVDALLSLPKELRFLLKIALATENGCTFCADLTLAEAVRSRLGKERFLALAGPELGDEFDAREKAAIAYARHLARDMHVPEAVMDELKRVFSEREVVEIVWTCAAERYFNSMALPLRIGSDRLAA